MKRSRPETLRSRAGSDACSRRAFLAAAAATSVAAGVAAEAADARAEEERAASPPVCVFSKHLRHLDYPDLARVCRELGLDGVDLTVRPGGHVTPERVAADLPRAVAAIRAEGLDAPMVTTAFNEGADADLRPTLEAIAAQGIRFFRCGGLVYDFSAPIAPQLDGFAERLRGLAAEAERAGVVGGYHNHSGGRNVGAPLWDLYEILRRVDSAALGSNFDVGHAVVEGGYGAWEINARLLAPHVRMMAVKDFRWVDGAVRWVPLGEGQVDLVGMLRIMREAGFGGPISLHFEYPTPSRDALLEHIAEAAKTLRAALAEAGYPARQA